MSNNDKPTPVDGEVIPEKPEAKSPDDAFWAKEVKDANAQAAKYRTRLRELEKQVEADKQKQLEEQGNFKSLYEQQKAEMKAREAEIEKHSVYKQAFESVLKRRVEAVPEANRSLIPDYDDPIKTSEWLDANWDRISNRKFPNLDPGAGSSSTASGGNGSAAISPEAQEVARRLKISPEKAAQLFKGK